MGLIVDTRERILAVMLARLTGSPRLTETDTSPGSPWWLLVNAATYEIRKWVLRIAASILDTVPSTAVSDDAVLAWAETFLPTSRLAATAWTGTITLYAETGYTPALDINAEIVAPDATRYQTTVAVVAGDWVAGEVTVTAEALTLGTAANKANGTALAVVEPPVGCRTTCILAATTTDGTDQETIAALKARTLTETKGRPGSGKPADYVAWAQESGQDTVTQACVYPTWGAGTVQDIIVVPLGPAGSHLPPALVANAVEAYILARNPIGSTPWCVYAGGAGADELDTVPVLLQVTVRPRPGYGPDWVPPAPTYAVAAGSVSPRVNLDADPTGVIGIGDRVVIPTLAGAVQTRTECTVTAVGASYVEVSVWPGTPEVGEDVLPGGTLHAPVVAAIGAAFDRLGSWPSNDANKPRYPENDVELPGWLYLSDVIAILEQVDGIESVAVEVLAVDGVPPFDAHADLVDEVAPGAAPAIYVAALNQYVAWEL